MTKKFVAVLNKKAETGQLLSALGHIAAGLAGDAGLAGEMGFISYFDAEGNAYPHISEYPFIVLRGKPGKIKQFRQALDEREIPWACYLDTMVEGGSEVQVARTKQTASDDLEILALLTFGDREALDPLTKKFSIWR